MRGHYVRFRYPRNFQVYTNLCYVAAGVLGLALSAVTPLSPIDSPSLRIFARCVTCFAAILVVVTGVVSTRYHQSDDDGLGTADVVFACTTGVVTAVVLFPLIVYSLCSGRVSRGYTIGSAVLVSLAAITGLSAVGVHVSLTRAHAKHEDPMHYDLAHGGWHVLSAASCACGFLAYYFGSAGFPRIKTGTTL
jgi:hypothetical protein